MKVLKLPRTNLEKFVLALGEMGKVHIPVRQGQRSFVFRRMEDGSDISKMDLDYKRTIIPLKKYFYHPTETMFHFSRNGYVIPTEPLKIHDIIFGVHACDIHAIQILDLFFSGKCRDEYYFAKKEHVSLIGISCVPDEFCFCNSMATNYVSEGFDLFLSEITNGYLVRVGTSRGDDMVNLSAQLFEPTTKEDAENYKKRSIERERRFSKFLDIRNLPAIMDLEYRSKLWDELGERCLSCGTCSMSCPTCYCYRIFDQMNLDNESGRRRRQWDSCLFRDHALVAGGHNFRLARSDRFKHRWLHKQQSFAGEFGRPSCVGCGRCIEFCPAKIDIAEELTRIQNVEKK